ncbi:16S rRNA (guanine(527)-N(7))-methyltransferase RsmG [Pseudodesulfovibrio sp. JC047]|uniref:16S rRNA (guanine(527)-N(7))-methyltransferase RsmG n=1 Tax=Pseudodesulfovibrio sp. JC047 TaxID=2683199 RepID=UPI0013D7A32E|nr:RsmG family class I SAM-dependent methyltransferase [Pseudodesulfovibrio sp. JC047]NDV18820.1 16S rRNA (guanine(527)-N(7))-methyltransferase RsmG [Pseudodesulfovibrio sp. JC047]
MAHMFPSQHDILTASTRLGRPVDADQAELLALYLGQLIKWNKKMNLVGKSDWRTVFDTLVVDSLYLADFLNGLPLTESSLCLDFGAGAGLPGIPLRTLWHTGDYWLVELREKRALFMRSALSRLKLSHTNVFHGRAENVLDHFDTDGAPPVADLILSRAFMPWPKLLEFIHPMLRKTSDQPGMAVILSNDPPPPPEKLSDGWVLEKSTQYPAAGGERFFWAVRVQGE